MDSIEERFGIGVSRDIGSLPDALKIIGGSGFKMLELPFAFMQESGMEKILASAAKEGLHVNTATNIAPAGVASGVADQSAKLKSDFIDNVSATIKSLSLAGVPRCTLNLLPENSFAHPEQRERKAELLRRLTPATVENKMSISIPVRIPQTAKTRIGEYSDFAAETMNPLVGLCVNIHPHELRESADSIEFLRPLMFKLSAMSIVYEPDAGNSLVHRTVAPWLNALEHLIPQSTVFFLPRTMSITTFAREIGRLHALAEDLLSEETDSR